MRHDDRPRVRVYCDTCAHRQENSAAAFTGETFILVWSNPVSLVRVLDSRTDQTFILSTRTHRVEAVEDE